MLVLSTLVLLRLYSRLVFSRMFPVDYASSVRSFFSSKSRFIFRVYQFSSSCTFLFSSSGFSWLITIESSLDYNPDFVIEQLITVMIPFMLDGSSIELFLVHRYNWKLGLQSTYCYPIFITFLDNCWKVSFLTTGTSISSTLSNYWMRRVLPNLTDSCSVLVNLGSCWLKIYILGFSFLNQSIACELESIIKGTLHEFSTTTQFYRESGSQGSPWLRHFSNVDSVVMNLR